jgi:Ferredoxin-like domain in Api92-like protein
MPNHIENIIVFKSNATDIEKIIGDEFSFKNICPLPNLEEDHDLIEWCCNNWGTKWDAYDVDELENHTDENGNLIIKYQFTTAWSPPEPWLNKIAEVCPNTNIELYWADEDLPNSGFLKYIDGVKTEEEYNDECKEQALAFLEEYFPDKYDTYQDYFGDESDENLEEESDSE